MSNSFASWLRGMPSTISGYLPEGGFKEWLRSYFWKHSNMMYTLGEITNEAEMEDGILVVKLNNGLKLYGQSDKSIFPAMKHGDRKRLGKIAEFNYFGCFFYMLYEQYIEDYYEKQYKLLSGGTVIDIGANIGIFTVKAAKEVGETGKVIAIEPESNNLKVLQRNIEANNLHNVIIIPNGVWSNKSSLSLFLSDHTWEYSFYKGEKANKSFEIEVDTLDNILHELGIKKVDFIKMDVEGAEVEALKGMNQVLENNDVKLAGEYHVINGKPTYKIIASQLKEKGFEVYKEGAIFYARKK